jgi:hypothetical protein
VIIVAEWKPYAMGIGSGGRGGSMKTIEVVTDKQGNYVVPGWIPLIRWPFTYLDHYDPELTVFKPGYYPQDLANEVLGSNNRNRGIIRTSMWDGKTIKLAPFKGDWIDYAHHLDYVWAPIGGHCKRECPRFVVALIAESKRIRTNAPKDRVPWFYVDISSFDEEDQAFFRQYQRRSENEN